MQANKVHAVVAMRKITPEKRKMIYDLWLAGDGYIRINKKTGVSTGSISGVISEVRKRIPDIDELRKLSLKVKNANSNIPDALRGANLLEKMNALEIDLKDVTTSIKLLEHYGDKASDVIVYAEILRRIEIARGKKYNEIVNELNVTTNALDTKKEEIKDADMKIQALKMELSALEQLKALQQKLDSHSISHSKLDEIIESKLYLEKLELTPSIALILANEMEKTGETPANAARKIVNALEEHGSLIDKNLELALLQENLIRSIKVLQSKEEDIKTAINSLKESKIEYDGIIQSTRETYGTLLDNIEESKNELGELKIDEEEIIMTLQRAGTSYNNLKDVINKNEMSKVIIALLFNPKDPIERRILFTTLIRFNVRLMEHIGANDHIVSNPENFIGKLSDLMNCMGMEYNIAK